MHWINNAHAYRIKVWQNRIPASMFSFYFMLFVLGLALVVLKSILTMCSVWAKGPVFVIETVLSGWSPNSSVGKYKALWPTKLKTFLAAGTSHVTQIKPARTNTEFCETDFIMTPSHNFRARATCLWLTSPEMTPTSMVFSLRNALLSADFVWLYRGHQLYV